MSEHRIEIKRFGNDEHEITEDATHEQAIAAIRDARFDRTVQNITVVGDAGCVYEGFRPLPHMSMMDANTKIFIPTGPPRSRLTLGRAGEKKSGV